MPQTETSLRPQARPASLVRQAAAIPDGQPAIVRENATRSHRFDPTAPMLIGTFGRAEAPRALIRLPSGKIADVARGDRLGRDLVAAIEDGTVILARGGRSTRLVLP